jgi:hypothetical protein
MFLDFSFLQYSKILHGKLGDFYVLYSIILIHNFFIWRNDKVAHNLENLITEIYIMATKDACYGIQCSKLRGRAA